jgi:hypothetical protein
MPPPGTEAAVRIDGQVQAGGGAVAGRIVAAALVEQRRAALRDQIETLARRGRLVGAERLAEGIFKWLRGRREPSHRQDEDASRFLAKSSEPVQPPSNADPRDLPTRWPHASAGRTSLGHAGAVQRLGRFGRLAI